MTEAAVARARAAFLRACELDVAVRKPGNVSLASPGHGMEAAQFLASAQAAAGPLFRTGSTVGERIEAAVRASWEAAGCNTNLGIVLLCAPLAKAMEQRPAATTAAALQAAIGSVLAGLDLEDARAAYRAIARAHPGGLGTAPAEDVHSAPTLDLRRAMALAAGRDLVARQYRDDCRDLFEIGLPALGPDPGAAVAGADAGAAVQRLFLALLAAYPDSHIVRKRGPEMAQTVMHAAQGWQQRLARRDVAVPPLDADPAYVRWDEMLKATGINPGTTADLTVATMMLAGWLQPAAAVGAEAALAPAAPGAAAGQWHGS
jgi:triphosphoribosyl-dephospho-CoA synthase